MKRFLLFAVSCTLALLLVEALTRAVLPPIRHWFPKGMYVSDPASSYRLASNFTGEVATPFFRYQVRTSSQGFRGPEFEPMPGQRLVAMFGDSFTFGQGVEEEDSYAGIIARGLGALGQQVINTGVYDYAMAQEYRTYERLNRQYRIDTILLQVFWNDIAVQSDPIKRGVYRGYLNANPPKSVWGRVKNELLLNSEFVNQAVLIWYKLRAAQMELPDFLTASYDTTKAREIRSTQELLEKWVREAAGRKQQFVVLYMPHEWQVDPNAPAIRRWRDQGRKIDLEAPHRWLLEFLGQHPQVIYVDVLAAFRRHYQAGGATLYIAGDGHANPGGNRLIAETIQAQLRRSIPASAHAEAP